MTTTKNNRDFSNGKIYKIEPTCEFEEGDIYIGSTTQDLLSKRMRNHRSDYVRWKKGKKGLCMSFILFDKYGIDKCKIILIENINASNYDELVSRETYFIKRLKCVNKFIPFRTDAEKKEYNDQKNKEYCESNKEKISEYQHQYSKINKKKISDKNRKYREANKEQIKKHLKEYYQANKEALKERAKQNRLKKKQENQANLNNTEIVNI